MNLLRVFGIAFLCLCVVTGCAARDPLPPKSAVVPAGVDLSGQWQLRNSSRESNRLIAELERKASGTGGSLIPSATGKGSKEKPDDMRVHVFLETGESLKLTQTEHGLFVSFDRAVVEEYRFGEQRIANVGAIAAERVSGWEDGAYVIETRDNEGIMLIETYRLEGADKMVRSIRIAEDFDVRLDVRQEFDRR